MSEGQVGSLYDRVIKSVIETSSSDFEEHGIPASTLRLFQETWQKKLSERKHAAFPWDPQSADQSMSHTHLNNGMKNGHLSSGPYSQPPPPQPIIINQGNMPMKQEAGVFDTSFLALPTSSYNSNPAYAAERAAGLANMHAAQNGLPHLPRNIAQQQHQPQIKQENNQTFDGAGDEFQDLPAVTNGPGTMRAQAEMGLQSLEAGGLLRPMDFSKMSIKAQKQPCGEKTSVEAASTVVAGLDGSDDPAPDRSGSPVADEDAINSDLDSDTSEDGRGDGEGGAGDSMKGDVIICLYDKVQRVKNKWKCTLKDGVVTINGKDYVFHKSNGEFEW